MSNQPELSLPPVPANDIIHEQIRDLEWQICQAGDRGDHATAQVLLRERTRLQRMIRATLEEAK